MYNLFTKFPIINYGGQLAVNITTKVKFNEAAKRAAAVFYPYTIEEGERPDIIAANYYEDARYSWLIYMVNDITDPYYEWPMTEEEFSSFIVKKYGSSEKATETIAFWRVNWYEDETVLNISGYDALPSYAKKYFAPLENNTRVVGYKRNKTDYAVDTNMIQQLTVSSTSGFIPGEQITQKTSGTITGTTFVKTIMDSTTLIVEHVLGAFYNTAGNYGNLIGQDSQTTVAITDVITLGQSIPDEEAVYWTYVTNMDYERELNEQKRYIKLLDKAYVDQVERELDQIL